MAGPAGGGLVTGRGTGPAPQTEREYLIQVYDVLQEIRATLVTISVRLEQQNGRLRTLEDQSPADQAKAVAALQLWQARMMGVLTVVSALSLTAAGIVLGPLVGKLVGK